MEKMDFEYPVRFELPEKAPKLSFPETGHPSPWGVSVRRTLPESAGKGKHRFIVAVISHWPETKTVMEQACTDLPWPIGHVCTDLPRIYLRDCELQVYIDVSYPDVAGALNDIEACVSSAALAGAIAAVIASPSAGAAVFEAALEGCLLAKGKEWASQVSASAGTASSCGDWHPV
jgi:hypothetical protein